MACFLSGELDQAFDLVKGPLLRLRIFKLGKEDHLLQLVVHHIVCDGWSFDVLLHDLGVLYSAACQGTEANLPEPMQFREYAAWEQEQPESTAGAAVEAYWVGQFTSDRILRFWSCLQTILGLLSKHTLAGNNRLPSTKSVLRS